MEKERHLTREQRNFVGGLWHGAFLALGVSLTQPTTVISAFIADLTHPTIWVGGLSTVLTVAGALPQLIIARWIEPRPRKMPYLLAAIYLRVISWGVLAWLIYSIGAEEPTILAWAMVIMLAVFYAGGGLGNIPYTELLAKLFPLTDGAPFFGGKEALTGSLAVSAALIARYILSRVNYPRNYAVLFGLASLGLLLASLGFLVIREPQDPIGKECVLRWGEYWIQIRTAGNA